MLHALVCVHALLYATAFLFFSLVYWHCPLGCIFSCVGTDAPLTVLAVRSRSRLETKSTRWRHSPPRVGTVNLVESTLWRHSPLVETQSILWGHVHLLGTQSTMWRHAHLVGTQSTLWRYSQPCEGTVTLVEAQSILYRHNLFCGAPVPLW